MNVQMMTTSIPLLNGMIAGELTTTKYYLEVYQAPNSSRPGIKSHVGARYIQASEPIVNISVAKTGVTIDSFSQRESMLYLLLFVAGF